jgi:homospermidine synthase
MNFFEERKTCLDQANKIKISAEISQNVLVFGYGAIGKCFCDILLSNFPHCNLMICDYVFDQNFPIDERIKVINMKITPHNIESLLDYLKEGDTLVDLSVDVSCIDIWSCCMKRGVMYLNSSLESWEDTGDLNCNPQNEEELYKTSIHYLRGLIEQNKYWNNTSGPTTVFEHGANPGLISHFMKKGLQDAATHFLMNKYKEEFSDLNFEDIKKFLEEKNYTKLAQALGLFTIHCSEVDNQLVENPPSDLGRKFYNTWSCPGLFLESFIPIQVALGNHEDKRDSEIFPRIKDKLIMSWDSSRNHYGNFLLFIKIFIK